MSFDMYRRILRNYGKFVRQNPVAARRLPAPGCSYRDTLRDLNTAQPFVIAAEISDFASEMRSGFWCAETASWRPPREALRLPAKNMVLAFEGCRQGAGVFHVSETRAGIRVRCLGEITPAVGWIEIRVDEAGEMIIELLDHEVDLDEHHLSRTAALIVMTLHVINQPRLVERGPAASRAKRMAARHWGFGKPVNAWHRVSWRIGDTVRAKIARDPGFHKMPLHFARGHWRRAEPHFGGATQLPNAIEPRLREGWWQWIEGCLKGHPCFGRKVSYHDPRISEKMIAKKFGSVEAGQCALGGGAV